MVSHNLIFLNQLKEFQNIDVGYTLLDDTYRMSIKSATSIIENFTRRKFTKQAHTKLFDTNLSFNMYWNTFGDSSDIDDAKSRKDNYVRYDLGSIPVSDSDPFSIRLDYSHEFPESTEIDPSDYILDRDKGLLFLKKPTVKGSKTLRVNFTAGYASATIASETALGNSIPDDLRMAALLVSSKVATELSNPNCSGEMSATKCISSAAYSILLNYKRVF